MKIKSLFWVFSIFYLIYEPLRVLLETGEIKEAFFALQGITELIAFISILIYLWAYALGAYWMFFKTYSKKKQWLSFSLLIPVALAAIFLRYFMQEILGRVLFGYGNYPDTTTLKYYIFDNLYYAITYISLGTVFFFIQYAQHKEVQQRELLLQNQKTELAFLRSQLNPHFLFNILNNIYTLIYYKSENALKSVEKLSGLLRYALYEKAEKVSLKKEIQYLNDFIDLHRMRLDHDLALQFHATPRVLPLKVAPFLFIPFVENAFKHGNLQDENKPIRIRLVTQEEDLVFTIENKKRVQEKDDVGGIGVQNIQKRLQLLYGEQSDLMIKETETEFKVQLKIALSAC